MHIREKEVKAYIQFALAICKQAQVHKKAVMKKTSSYNDKYLLDNLEQRRKRLTDLYLDEGISKETYDEKYEELTMKIQKTGESIRILQDNVSNLKDVSKRMASLKKALADGDILDEFDRVVFESIVEKVIVGETNDDGTVDPFKLTFVMKGNGNSVVPNAKEWFKAEKVQQRPHRLWYNFLSYILYRL